MNKTQLVDQIAKQWSGVCANMANVLPRVGSEGGYPFAEANFECVDPKPSPSAPRAQLKKYERMMMKVIQGRDGLYIMQRAWHSDTDPKPKGVAGVDPDTEWKAFFAGVGQDGSAGIWENTPEDHPEFREHYKRHLAKAARKMLTHRHRCRAGSTFTHGGEDHDATQRIPHRLARRATQWHLRARGDGGQGW